LLAALALAMWPGAAMAGGPEFPAGGTRSLGRGAAGFLRADDPSTMTRNPALLADLVDDQAMLGAHFLLPKACFTPTGAQGWSVKNEDVSNFGDGPVFQQAQKGDTDLNGKPLKGYQDDPFPTVCYKGGAIFLPQLALSMKLSPDLGVGIGFFPPDASAINQWGNRDGTIDTPDGKRPNPLRYYRSHLSFSFFSILSAIGYRVADWLKIGAAFQWNVAAFQATTWTTALSNRDPHNDIRTDVFGRDLFIPGFIASVESSPVENLDVAAGFKWSDRVVSKAKLDLTAGAFGTGQVFHYVDAMGNMHAVGSSIPTTTYNQPGTVNSPPIWVPQLSFGVRYADRLKPKPQDREKAKLLASPKVEDHMATERWDIEADAIYYFSSAFDYQGFTDRNATLTLRNIDAATGVVSNTAANVGRCTTPLDPKSHLCPGDRVVKTINGGKNQITARVGGDYNVFPGIFAIRAGVSYETDGQKVEFLNVMNYMMRRLGIHGGFTLRVADKTDISFGFAHFIQRKVKLQVNDVSATNLYPRKYKTADYHFQPGLGVADFEGNAAPGKNGFDGIAGVEVPNGDASQPIDKTGPDFVNAGSYFYNLDVASLTFTQHF
jgi:long-subunit fatty acid transport protein